MGATEGGGARVDVSAEAFAGAQVSPPLGALLAAGGALAIDSAAMGAAGGVSAARGVAAGGSAAAGLRPVEDAVRATALFRGTAATAFSSHDTCSKPRYEYLRLILLNLLC